MATIETFHHIIAETGVTQIILQIFQIRFDHLLHIFALVVDVTATSKVGSLIIVLAEAYPVCGSLGCCCSAIIILADVCRLHLVGHSLVGFCREGEPAVCIAVVDDYISNSTYTSGFKLSNQTSELSLRSERRVLIKIVIWHITHHLSGLHTFSALWKPNKVDITFQLISLLL